MEERWVTDWTPSARFPLYTRANAGEIMPDPCSPLGWDLVWGAGGVAHGWADGCHRFGTFTPEETNPDEPDYVGCFGGYLYLNASLIRLVGVRSPGMSAEAMDAAFLGDHPDVPPYVPAAGDDRPELEAGIGATMASFLEATVEPAELAADRAEMIAIAEGRPDLAAATELELVVRARSMLDPIRRFFERYYIYGTASAIGPGILGEVTGPIDPTLAGRLISGLGDIDSAPPAFAIWDMSRVVRDSNELSAAFDAGVDELMERLAVTDDGAELLADLASFQAEHGARGPGEWDAANPTWGIDLQPVLVAIDRMRYADDDVSPSARSARAVADRKAAELEARTALAGSEEALGALDMGMRVARIFVPTRERTKLTQMMAVHEVRLPMYELGQRMVERGALENARQIFLLLDVELDDFLADPGRFRAIVRQRETEFERLGDLQDPFIINGEVPPLSSWPERTSSAPRVEVGDELRGVPGSPGVAVGRSRVVEDPFDAEGLEPGEILVAPITDPAWTPLFVPAAGVVVEVGAPLSHSVIVSREFGIPCAVGVYEAAQRIPNGALISVDGGTGVVTILELPDVG